MKKLIKKYSTVFTKKFSKRRKKGVALLLVIVIISILIPIVTDMNYESQTEFEMAMNYKRKAEARVLAKSAAHFATIVFDLQSQLEKTLESFGVGRSFEIWDIVPFDTVLLRTFVEAGPFADMENLVGQRGVRDGNNGSSGETDTSSANEAFYARDGDPVFEFPGNFRLEFENEDTKINLNNISYGTRNVVISMLEAIIEPDIYDFLFVDNTSRREYVDRMELIQNIVDWVDTDNERYDDGEKYRGGGDEQSLYDSFEPRVKVKNARFDTVDELRMIYGVTDVVYRLLKPYITIFSTGKININKASPRMIEAIIRNYAQDKSLTMFYDDIAMREFLGKILAGRARDGFDTVDGFMKICAENEVVLDKGVKDVVDTEGNVYRIRAVGEKQGVESWIEMIVDKKGNIYYYRQG
ncbi:MAG: type II secretion system protein GspK [bacterium]